MQQSETGLFSVSALGVVTKSPEPDARDQWARPEIRRKSDSESQDLSPRTSPGDRTRVTVVGGALDKQIKQQQQQQQQRQKKNNHLLTRFIRAC